MERGNGAALHQLECCSVTYLRVYLPGCLKQKDDQGHTVEESRVSAGHWNDVYTPDKDNSRRETVVMLEVARESKGFIYLTIEEVALHGEEPVEIVISGQVLYQTGELTIPARPDSGVEMRQGPSGPGPKPDDGGKKEDANKENQGEDNPMEGKGDKMNEFDLGAPERDLLEYGSMKRNMVALMRSQC